MWDKLWDKIKDPAVMTFVGAAIGIAGALLAAYGTLRASYQQNEDNKKNADKLDSAASLTVKTQQLLIEKQKEEAENYKKIIALNEELREKSDNQIRLSTKNNFPLSDQVKIRIDISFDVIKNKLEPFENIVLNAFSDEAIARAKIDKSAPYLNLPDHLLTSRENPFLQYTMGYLYAYFFNSEESNTANMTDVVYSIGGHYTMRLALEEYFQELQNTSKNDQNFSLKFSRMETEPLLNISYNPQKRTFEMGILGGMKDFSAHISNPNNGSVYDLANTNLVFWISPQAPNYIYNPQTPFNEQLNDKSFYNVNKLTIRFPNSYWISVNEFKNIIAADKRILHTYRVSYKDLGITQLK